MASREWGVLDWNMPIVLTYTGSLEAITSVDVNVIDCTYSYMS